MMRLFVALRPPLAVRHRLRATAGGIPLARWQDDGQLHLTLRYIGEVEPRMAQEIAAALSRLCGAAPAIRLSGVGRFARRGRTDTLWAGVSPHDALGALHRKVDRALVQLGLEPERRAFLPHITVARLPRGADAEREVDAWLALHAGLTSQPFVMQHIVLFESILGREAARYEALTRCELDLSGDHL